MSRYLLLLTLLFAFQAVAFSQEKPYFQQRVDYQIDVQVLPEQKTLKGFERIIYTNNSPDTLHFIYFHLWPNAYQPNSALAKQQARFGQALVMFNRKYQGYIDSLDFKINGQPAKWNECIKNPDIIQLQLNEPLLPGEKIEITTPFFVKIPRISSRMGYNDHSIAITQWYPKPAVYDKYGWHPIPYLDQGEFYSEFGSFDVKITLPSQYVVAATGNMLDSVEAQWQSRLTDRPGKQVPYPTGKPLKTVRFFQDSIHDFAIFVSDEYMVRQSQVQLPHSGRTVRTKVYFYDKDSDWPEAVKFVDSAIYYYSLWVGDYPYKVASAVEGPLRAGGGMEYPTITVIAGKRGLEPVIVHEVGHNWFYGVLGFNERYFPFLDEGINSYYDHRYRARKTPNLIVLDHPIGPWTVYGMLHPNLILLNFNMPLCLDAEEYTRLTYGTIVYEKTAFSLHYLEQYLGTDQFDRIMQAFYKKWKFKHPYPEDFKQIFDSLSKKPVDWYFDDVVCSNGLIDYKVKVGLRGTVVKNTGQVKAPVPVEYDFIKNKKQTWAMLKPGQSKVYFPVKTKTQIDPQTISLDWYPYNNYTSGKFFGKPIKVYFPFPKLYDFTENHFAITPIIFWRKATSWLPGIAWHNFTLPLRKFMYAFAGFYSFKKDQPYLLGYFNYRRPTSLGFPAISLSGYFDNFDLEQFNLPRKAYLKLKLDFFNINASDRFGKTLNLGVTVTRPQQEHLLLGFAEFWWYKRSAFHPLFAKAFATYGYPVKLYDSLLTGQKIFMLGAELNYKLFHYVSLKTGLDMRLFIGWQTPLNAMTAATDYLMNNQFVTRYPEGYLKNEIEPGYGNFVLPTPYDSYQNTKGRIVTAINLSSTLPVKGLELLGGFANFGNVGLKENFWEAGFMLRLSSIKVYFPLISSDNLRQTFEPGRTYRISFSIGLPMDYFIRQL